MIRLPAAGSAGAEERHAPTRAGPTRSERRPRGRGAGAEDAGSDPGGDDPGDADADGGGRSPGDDGDAERGALREPPPGTPPAIARVFRRLPVSVSDGPPVAGIGASGIHVDKIWLGSRHDKQGCAGKSDGFSIRGRDEVNVCFRVVHGRGEEDVDVIWEKDGDLAQRRRGVTIPPLHAYRTRAYLVLRNEYVGAWRVRVYSEDGVELASSTFHVVE